MKSQGKKTQPTGKGGAQGKATAQETQRGQQKARGGTAAAPGTAKGDTAKQKQPSTPLTPAPQDTPPTYYYK